MNYRIHPYRLEFKHPFKIAHTLRDHTLNAYLEIWDDSCRAWGELVFPPYYPETLDSFTQFLTSIDLPIIHGIADVHLFMDHVHATVEGNLFAKAGLDIALHNFAAVKESKSISELYQLKPTSTQTSFTIGISSDREMIEKIQVAEQFEYIKLKVDGKEIERIITCFRAHSDKAFVVDANQGFEDREKTLEWTHRLHEMKVAYFEQPFHKDDLASHQWLKERSPIPIIADESFQTIDSMDRIAEAFDGINVKLMKCGGVYAGYKSMKLAQQKKLKVVLGCMSESSVAIDAAWQIAGLADWVDLDGPYLIKNDDFLDKQ